MSGRAFGQSKADSIVQYMSLQVWATVCLLDVLDWVALNCHWVYINNLLLHIAAEACLPKQGVAIDIATQDQPKTPLFKFVAHTL